MNLPSASHGRMKIVVSDTTGDPEDSEPVGGLNRSAMVKKTPLLERANFATVYWFSVSSEYVNAAQGRLMRADCGHSQISFGEKSRKPDDLDKARTYASLRGVRVKSDDRVSSLASVPVVGSATGVCSSAPLAGGR